MKITRRKLIDLAHREADRRAGEEDIVSAYLIGSVVRGEPLLGGAADIDLILIHANPPRISREVVPLSQDVHLDIAHHDRGRYAEPRSLRTSPWMGPALYDPLFILDPEHFLEWAQASARSQFNRADYRLARATGLLGQARNRLVRLGGQHSPGWMDDYARAAADGANAVALLVGPPATGRRLAVTLGQRTAEAGHPEVFDAFIGLIGGQSAHDPDLQERISAWSRDFEAASSASTDPRLAGPRMRYHLAGFEALRLAGWPQAVVWGLLSTWHIAVEAVNSDTNGGSPHPEWDDFVQHLDLGAASAQRRKGDLERFLDRVEEILDMWATEHGA